MSESNQRIAKVATLNNETNIKVGNEVEDDLSKNSESSILGHKLELPTQKVAKIEAQIRFHNKKADEVLPATPIVELDAAYPIARVADKTEIVGYVVPAKQEGVSIAETATVVYEFQDIEIEGIIYSAYSESLEPSQVVKSEPSIYAEGDEGHKEVDLVVMHIKEAMEISLKMIEQTEMLVVALPEVVQARLVEFMQAEDLEVVEPVQELVVEMATAADRLHELFETGELEGDEAEQIIELLVEQYVELLTQLEIEIDEEIIAAFIEQICSEAYTPVAKKADQPFKDIFGEQRGRLGISSSLSYLVSAGAIEAARLMVRRSMATVA